MSAAVLDKCSELITTAPGLVVALAWNAAIQQLERAKRLEAERDRSLLGLGRSKVPSLPAGALAT